MLAPVTETELSSFHNEKLDGDIILFPAILNTVDVFYMQWHEQKII